MSTFPSVFSEYNQKDATFLSLFISVRRCTCFRRLFCPSSRVQNCTYSVRHLSDRYCYLLLAAGSSNGLKHVQRLKKINNLRKVAFYWLYSEIILGMNGSMNVKLSSVLMITMYRPFWSSRNVVNCDNIFRILSRFSCNHDTGYTKYKHHSREYRC